MEYDIGNLESDDFKNRRAELKSEVSLIIDKIKKNRCYLSIRSANRLTGSESLRVYRLVNPIMNLLPSWEIMALEKPPLSEF